MEVSASTVTEEGTLCAGWLSQPAPATLQPLAPWTPYTEYVSHEAVSCPYSTDMYVQPVCPSYTVVGPSSVLTYASPPLITNVTVCHTKVEIYPPMLIHPLRRFGFLVYWFPWLLGQLSSLHPPGWLVPIPINWNYLFSTKTLYAWVVTSFTSVGWEDLLLLAQTFPATLEAVGLSEWSF